MTLSWCELLNGKIATQTDQATSVCAVGEVFVLVRQKRKDTVERSEVSGAFVPASQELSHSQRLSGKKRHNSVSFETRFADRGMHHSVSAAESFEQYSRNSAQYVHGQQRVSSRGGKILAALIVVVLIVGVAALGFYIYKEMQKAQVNQGLHNMSAEVLQAIDEELTGMTTFEEPFTVLLLGSDERNGEDEVDIGARTDTIILCRIDPTQNIISLVSIPRDTMVTLSGGSQEKINAAYSYGGPGGTIAAVKNLCGVEIDHYAEINFEGLIGLVDAIGGIDVYNDEEIDDPAAGDGILPEGPIHLDGYHALVFSRSRQFADGDFTRVSNQRKVIEAILHRGLEAPASELYGLIQASTEFLKTDTTMDVDFIFSLADQIRHNNDYPVQVFSATIPASTDMINGISYVIADQYGVDEMMSVLVEGGDVSNISAANTTTDTTDTDASSGVASGYDDSITGNDSTTEYYYGT